MAACWASSLGAPALPAGIWAPTAAPTSFWLTRSQATADPGALADGPLLAAAEAEGSALGGADGEEPPSSTGLPVGVPADGVVEPVQAAARITTLASTSTSRLFIVDPSPRTGPWQPGRDQSIPVPRQIIAQAAARREHAKES